MNKKSEAYENFSEKRYLTLKEMVYRVKDENIINFIKTEREKRKVAINFSDHKNNKFYYIKTEYIQKLVKEIRSNISFGVFKLDERILKTIKNETLLEESFNSSVIEGAFSTKKRQKELLENNIEPKNKSEKMIVNNYYALEFVLENLDREFDLEFMLNLHKILTKETFDEIDESGQIREDKVYVKNGLDEIIYAAPSEKYLDMLLDGFTKIMNEPDEDILIKSIIIHFIFVYIHPFSDGNGRTARALQYYYLLKNGYDFFRFFSISHILQEDRQGYYKAIKKVEDNDLDLNYFIYFLLEALLKNIIEIREKYLKEYSKQFLFMKIKEENIRLSNRQKNELNKLFRRKNLVETNEIYRKSQKTSIETARKDLNDLVKKGIFVKKSEGKKELFLVNI